MGHQTKGWRKPANGEVYENTKQNFQALISASRYARHLVLINADSIIDRRTPEKPRINMPTHTPSGPYTSLHLFDPVVPSIDVDNLVAYLPRPEMHVFGYEYSHGHQPYLIELWSEKSSMNDILPRTAK